MQTTRKHAFTLIELLTVIAIIGILAGILIPTVGSVRKQANIAASKSQLSGYVNAIQMFKGEYNYYPFSETHADGGANVNGLGDNFIQTLSGRNGSATVQVGGNRRSIAFHSFAETEFAYDEATGDVDPTTIADRFNNSNIFIAIDGNGDNQITVPDPSDPSENQTIRAGVTAYTETNADDAPDYYLYQ